MEIRFGLEWLYILGVDRVWNYHPHQREYLEKPLTHERAQNVRETGKEWSRQYAERFVLLPKMDARINFQRWGRVKSKAGVHRCAAISIDPGAEFGWREQVWIDPISALIWKCVTDRPSGTSTLLWHKIQIGQPLDPGIFVFHPPKSAVRREKLSGYEGRQSRR